MLFRSTSCHRWDHGFANVRGSSSLRTPWALRAGRHLFSLWGQAPWVLFLGVSASTSRLVLHSRIGKLYLLLRTCPAPCFLASPKSRGPASRARPPRTTVLLTRPRPGLISALVNSREERGERERDREKEKRESEEWTKNVEKEKKERDTSVIDIESNTGRPLSSHLSSVTPRPAMSSGPRSPQLEKALAQKRRPNTAKNKYK